MERQEDIAARRLGIVVEQYVEARKKRYDYVSTEQAHRAIRQILKPAISDRELDDMVALLAIKNGLAVVFDRRNSGATNSAEGDGRYTSSP